MAKKMKLVEILARELKEWPKEDGKYFDYIVQEGDKDLYATKKAPPVFGGGVAWYCDKSTVSSGEYFDTFASDLASDYKTSVITRSMWESERAKLAKPKGGKDGWRRHRGGKQPVGDDQVVEYRMRSGHESKNPERAADLRWIHCSVSGDIMAYRVIDQPSKEIPDPAKYIETLTESPNPIQWRDRVKELDERKSCLDAAHAKHTADIAKERGELIGKLQAQGFMLIRASGEVIDDMIDPRSWMKGDILRALNSADEEFTAGKYYILSKDVDTSHHCKICSDDRGLPNGWGADNFAWCARTPK